MKFYMPVRVFDEEECVAAHAKDIAAFGHKALIVTGRHSAKACGAFDDVTAALLDNGKEYCLFDQIDENPSVEIVRKGALYGMEAGAGFVIGIGGGSPMDAAKAIAHLMYLGDADSDLYDKSLSPEALPVIAVPTTCGTGSEVTGVSVLTVHEKNTKMSIPYKIFPKLALIDGKYLRSARYEMVRDTAVDALAHMIESYESTSADDYSRAAVLYGLSVWKRSKDVISGKAAASDANYADMMRASAFAGIAIAQTGTSIPHALSYILTYDLKMPHGRACGYFLKNYLQEAQQEDREQILQAAGFTDFEDFAAYMDSLYAGETVPAETLQRAYDVVVQNTARLKGCRFHADAEVLKRIAGL